MEWAEAISEAVRFIERHITEDITLYDVADSVNMSPFYFHKGFSMLCGYSVMEYIRKRRMALAGEELITSDVMVMELAMKYGYDSPDSFTRSFSRFHGSTPLAVRRNYTMLKTFAPLKLTIALKGGYVMDYRITKKRLLRYWAYQRSSVMRMHSRRFQCFGRSIIPRGDVNMYGGCSVSISTRRWGTSSSNI